MSLPSVKLVAQEKGIDLSRPTVAEQEIVLVEAMRRDLAPAVELLHQKSHEAQKSPEGYSEWEFDPSSDIGKQLTRIHAGTVLRKLAIKNFCHGEELTFINCCKGYVGKAPEDLMLTQIHYQDGTSARPDC